MLIEEREFLGGTKIGGARPFFLIAGPCVIEGRDMLERVCESMLEITSRLHIPFIFKSSFDKANRSSADSQRGPGLEEGLQDLAHIRESYNIPVLTDIHDVSQVAPVAEVVDILQIPAFLSRQTDLIVESAKTGKWINVKKGQFMAPADTGKIVDKIRATGSERYTITERGASFGYNNLVFDPRSHEIMHRMNIPVVYDATHSTQMPGGGKQSGGDRSMTPVLLRAAVAAGLEGIFMEVHPEPEKAWSDSSNQFPLPRVEELLRGMVELDRLAKNSLLSYSLE